MQCTSHISIDKIQAAHTELEMRTGYRLYHTHTHTRTHEWKRGELSVNRLPAIDVNVII